ncbi:hypothetical protein [Povalibacter sp.]|uniref:PDC sensor domain-containing protein n=1 Tax=Povalibacter sp. TaxID=1962978 RepID=UPI002F425BCF
MPKLRTSWIPMVLTVMVVSTVTLLGYFGLQYLRSSTFQEGRAFRVLGEIAQQFDNMQGGMSSLLTLIPESVFDADCEPDPRKVHLYLGKLDLRDLKLESLPNPQTKEHAPATITSAASRLTIYIDDPRRPFTVGPGVVAVGNDGSGCAMQLRGNLQKHLPAFTGQRYFDEVMLALPDGTVLATIGNRDAYPLQVPLQEDTADPIVVASASTLLEHASAVAGQGKFHFGTEPTAPAAAKGSVPEHAVAFTRTLGERSYEVSVLPLVPPNGVYVDDNSTDPGGARAAPTLYLLGLKRENLAQQASDTLGSGGAFAATIVVLLGVLLWPFLSLRLSPPESAIAGFQAFGVVVALVLLPIVLTSSAVWIWTQIRLQAWADRGSETYALQIEQTVRSELDEAAWLLNSYSQLARDPRRAQSAYLRRSPDGLPVQAKINRSDCVPLNPTCKMFLDGPTDPARTQLRNWSPLRTALILRAEGDSAPPRFSAFGDVPVKTAINLADRKYFQALRAGQAWKPRWASPDTPEFVAQRLFNRADAARVLQVAVSREWTDHWKGIITGDTRLYALSATVKPPLLRFAVVDTSSGEVLFHSNDERSLTENLLVETERNVRLQQALQSRGGGRRTIDLIDHFDGKYLGEPHRFYYRPIQSVPWGIVVLYPTESLRDVSFDAAIATLTHCISIVTVLVLAIVVIAFLWNRRVDRYLLAAIWPQWDWRTHYPRVALALTAFWLIALAALICAVRFNAWPMALAVIALAAAGGGWVICRSQWRLVRNPGIGMYRLFYAWAAVAILCVIVVLPTLVLAIGYQDMATGDYVRAQLSLAAKDIERRELLMQRDLLRWVPIDRDRHRKYPTAHTLAAALPVPGFRTVRYDEETERCDAPTRPAEHPYCWEVLTFDWLPWIDVGGPGEAGSFRRLIWRNVTFGNPQRRTSSATPRNVVSDAPGAPTGSNITLRRRLAVMEARGRLPEELLLARRGNCSDVTDGRPCLSESADVQHRDRRSSLNTAMLLGMGLILTLAWLVAVATRRLFGIRIPFAARFVDPPDRPLPFGALLATEQRIDQARAEFGPAFTGKDAIDIRRIESGPIYREVWRSLTGEERHLLHQLARGYFANPENVVVVERLLHRGFVRLRPWPVITDPGLAEFARSAPDHEEFHQDQLDWDSAQAGSTWHRIRIPLLSGGLMIAIGLMAFAGGTMQIVLTSLAGISALLGHVSNLTNFVRKGDTGK